MIYLLKLRSFSQSGSHGGQACHQLFANLEEMWSRSMGRNR